MMDDLQQAYTAYQQAVYHLRDPKVGPSGVFFFFFPPFPFFPPQKGFPR